MSETLFEQPGLVTGGPQALIDNSRFLFFIGLAVDAMIFAGLVGAYFVLRGGATTWPPADLPHLHTALVARSIICLAAAAILLGISVIMQNRNALKSMRASLLVAVIALAGFLVLNALEWESLLSNGIPVRTVFGGIYFLVTGVFHLHILACMVYILSKYRWTLHWRRYTRSALSYLHLSYFVSAMLVIWLGIFGVIYL